MIKSLLLKFFYLIIFVFIIFLDIVFTKSTKADNLLKEAEEFILLNEVSNVWQFKAYKDTQWTICNGITYTFEKEQKKKKKCKIYDNSKKYKYICYIKKNDIFTLDQCKEQSKLHIEYIIDKLENKYLIGRSKRNWYYSLKNNHKVFLIDIVFNYGETKKEVKELFDILKETINAPIEENKLRLIDKTLSLCETKHKKYLKGQLNRCNRRIMKFIES